MKWLCQRNFYMRDIDEPIPFIAGKEYYGDLVCETKAGIAVFRLVNEQGFVHDMDEHDINNYFTPKLF